MFAAITKLAAFARLCRDSSPRCSSGFDRFRRCEGLTTGRVCLTEMRRSALAETSRFLNDALTR